jgi:hypothetical protein
MSGIDVDDFTEATAVRGRLAFLRSLRLSLRSLRSFWSCPPACLLPAYPPACLPAPPLCGHLELVAVVYHAQDFLSKVPLLASMDKYERAKVADALKTKSFAAGEYIITVCVPVPEFESFAVFVHLCFIIGWTFCGGRRATQRTRTFIF